MARRPLVDPEVDDRESDVEPVERAETVEAVEAAQAESNAESVAEVEAVADEIEPVDESTVDDEAEPVDGAEPADQPQIAVGSDLPPPVYVPVDRTAWLRARRSTVDPTEALPGEQTVELDPVLGPPNPDSTAEIMRQPIKPARPLRKPVIIQRRRKPRVRRVTRVVRHVDSWSVFKVALVFNAFLYIVLMTSGVLLWQVARATGTVDNVERFFESFGWRTFKLNGGAIYHNAWIAGIFVAIAFTGIAVLAATLFNLITDLVGGVRVTVLEEEVRTRDERIRPLMPPVEEEVDDEVALVPPSESADEPDPLDPPIVDQQPNEVE